MIMEKTAPRMLGAAGKLAVVAAAVLLLSFLPTWAQESREGEIREVKRKLERVERAMGALREAGLRPEVEHLERVAHELRRHLDGLVGDEAERVRGDQPRRGDEPRGDSEMRRRKERLEELERQIDRLRRQGRHEEAEAVREEFRALRHAIEDEKEAREREAVERREALARLEDHLVELKAHHRELAGAGRLEEAEAVEREMVRVDRELDEHRRALERWARGRPETDRPARAGHPIERGRIAQDLARLRKLEFKREQLKRHMEELEEAGREDALERAEHAFERLAREIDEVRRAVELGRVRERGRRFRPIPEGGPEAELQARLLEYRHAIERHQKVIAGLKRALEETARRQEELVAEVERLKRMLHERRDDRDRDDRDREARPDDRQKRRKM